MADITGLNSSMLVSIVGSDSSGGETNPVNSNSQGRLLVETKIYQPPTFSSTVTSVAPGNNKSMLAIFNPVASGKIIRIKDLKIINVQTTAVTGVFLSIEQRRITGFSGGTLISAASNDTLDVSSGVVRSASNVSGEGGLVKRVLISSDELSIKNL